MTLDPWTLLAILTMAAATYACRGGGYWLFRQITPSPLIRAILAYVPGTLFVSFVVPAIVQGGLQPMAGAAGTVARSWALSIAAGVAGSWAVWAFR